MRTSVTPTYSPCEEDKVLLSPSAKEQTIFSAAKEGNLEEVLNLIKNGTKVNFRNSLGKTPLMLAAMNNHKDVAVVLLENGANPNTVDRHGNTALLLALKYGNYNLANTLANCTRMGKLKLTLSKVGEELRGSYLDEVTGASDSENQQRPDAEEGSSVLVESDHAKMNGSLAKIDNAVDKSLNAGTSQQSPTSRFYSRDDQTISCPRERAFEKHFLKEVLNSSRRQGREEMKIATKMYPKKNIK